MQFTGQCDESVMWLKYVWCLIKFSLKSELKRNCSASFHFNMFSLSRGVWYTKVVTQKRLEIWDGFEGLRRKELYATVIHCFTKHPLYHSIPTISTEELLHAFTIPPYPSASVPSAQPSIPWRCDPWPGNKSLTCPVARIVPFIRFEATSCKLFPRMSNALL